PLDWLSLGASYRSEVRQDVNGDAEFDMPEGLGPDTTLDAKGTVNLPEQFMFGVAVRPIERLSVEADVVLTGWSSYDELRIEFDNGQTSQSTKNWNDVVRYQVGLEYAATEWLDLRLGYVYDNSPIDADFADYMVPANDRQLYCAGAGFKWGSWDLDVAYTYLQIKDRSVIVNVTRSEKPKLVDSQQADFEDGHAHIVSLSVGYAF
ncbi:MAG: OmpP1/FadL family transporter, partial [Desulfovibrionales bacterium]